MKEFNYLKFSKNPKPYFKSKKECGVFYSNLAQKNIFEYRRLLYEEINDKYHVILSWKYVLNFLYLGFILDWKINEIKKSYLILSILDDYVSKKYNMNLYS